MSVALVRNRYWYCRALLRERGPVSTVLLLAVESDTCIRTWRTRKHSRFKYISVAFVLLVSSFLSFRYLGRRWLDFPSLYAWLRDVYQLPGVADTIDVDAARRSYFAQLL